MTTEREPLKLRMMAKADWPLMEKWLNQAFIKRWLTEPESWLKEIRNEGGAFSWIRHFMAGLSGETIGFAQYYECALTGDGQAWQNEAPGTFGIDYIIGREELIGRGLGKELVGCICDLLIIEEKPAFIIADPDPENAASIKSLIFNGFDLDPATSLYKKAVK